MGRVRAFFDGGERIHVRDPSERMSEEVYRSIPALNAFANAAMAVGNKVSLEARNALFFDKGADPELRALKVENALVKRHELDSIQPDLEWLQSASPAKRKDFESSTDDVWLGPPEPGA